jgi:hypothetical protein
MDALSLPARNLVPAELEQLVNRLADQPERWREHVSFTAAARRYASLYRDDYLDLWVLCWTPAGDTGWHDHDLSAGAVRVIAGGLIEANPRIGGEPAFRSVRAGQSFSFGPEHIHRLSGDQAASISLHAYSPPLWRLGQYSIDRDGVMRRQSVSYADELRPLEPALAA